MDAAELWGGNWCCWTCASLERGLGGETGLSPFPPKADYVSLRSRGHATGKRLLCLWGSQGRDPDSGAAESRRRTVPAGRTSL